MDRTIYQKPRLFHSQPTKEDGKVEGVVNKAKISEEKEKSVQVDFD